MELSAEIQQLAQMLGKTLQDHPSVRAYLEACERVRADRESSALEQQLYDLYQNILARQQSGEQIPRNLIEDFYTLRDRLFTHPLIVERETALKVVKSLFTEIANEISLPLGLDYTALVKER